MYGELSKSQIEFKKENKEKIEAMRKVIGDGRDQKIISPILYKLKALISKL